MADVNDHEVWRLIHQELLLAAGPTIVEKTCGAWHAMTKRQRDGAHATDADLAAAQHYMFNRFLTGVTGDRQAHLYPAGYFPRQALFFIFGREPDFRAAASTGLPPSLSSVAWGNQGADDGLDDYHGMNAATGARVGASIESLRLRD